MKPTISTSKKGDITIENKSIDYDFYINLEGRVVKRDTKSLTKDSPTLQTISLAEADKIYDPSINEMIIGWDKNDNLTLSNEATDYFEKKKCKIKLLPFSEAITYWNRYDGHAIGLFHFSS